MQSKYKKDLCIYKQRIHLLVELGNYMSSNEMHWLSVRLRASQENGWFIPEFIDLSVQNIVSQFLVENKLKNWVKQYALHEERKDIKTIGLVMAGNIPLVGFHDFLSVFISGHRNNHQTLYQRFGNDQAFG